MAERRLELEREAAQATRQPAVYTDMTVSFSESISPGRRISQLRAAARGRRRRWWRSPASVLGSNAEA